MTWLSLFLVLSGPFFGSFVHASANIWPHREPFRQLRSKCDHCQRHLNFAELIPIFSYLALRGKCRTCNQPIGFKALLAELIAALIGLASVLIFSDWMQLASAFLGWVLLYAALVDARLRLLPDGSSFALIASGIMVSTANFGLDGFWQSVLAAGMGYLAFFGIAWAYKKFRGRDGLGMGDAKLLAAGGAWCGPYSLSWIVLLAALLALAGVLLQSLLSKKPLRGDTALAFGPALALAIYLVWLGFGLLFWF